MFMAVYRGKKESFPNYLMYAVDMKKGAATVKHNALDEEIITLSLAAIGERHEASGVWGTNFPYGSTGMISLGDGYFYFSQDFGNGRENPWGTNVALYRFDGNAFLPI